MNQTYRNLEIILVDDGSTDASGDICDEYARQDGRVRVIHKENGGNGDARNAGLRIARGQWITMSDNDDILHKRQIETLLAVAHEKDADIAVGSYRPFEVHEVPVEDEIQDDFLSMAEVLSDKHLYDDAFIQKRSLILTVPWSKICRKEVYRDVWYPAKSMMTHGQRGNCMKMRKGLLFYRLYCIIGGMTPTHLGEGSLIRHILRGWTHSVSRWSILSSMENNGMSRLHSPCFWRPFFGVITV